MAPRHLQDPGSYAIHPHAPSEFRKEQLAEPWEESTAANAFLQTPTAGAGPNFITTVKNSQGLFGQDPEFWKTVHLGGSGRAREEEARKAAEKVRRRPTGPHQRLHACTGQQVKKNNPARAHARAPV